MSLLGSCVMMATSGASALEPDSPSPPQPQDVIARFVEVTGGQAAWDQVHGMHRTTRWSQGEDTGLIEVRSRPGGDFVVVMTMDGSTWRERQGSVGERAWLEDANGVCHPAHPSIADQLKFQYDPKAIIDLGEHSKAITVTGQVDIDGKPQWRLIAAPQVGRPRYLYFDVDTGLLTRMEFSRPGVDGSPMKIERTWSGWEDATPVKWPSQCLERSPAGEVTFVTEQVSFSKPKAGSIELTECAKEGFDRVAKEEMQKVADGSAHADLVSAIGADMVLSDGTKVPSSSLTTKPNVLLYFTAKWCGPCRRFTPQLVKFAKDHADREDFEIVMVSSDRSKDQMMAYLKDYGISFPAVPFERRDTSGIKRRWGARGIPNLVWLGPDDEVIASTYVNNKYQGPQKVLDAFSDHLNRTAGADGG